MRRAERGLPPPLKLSSSIAFRTACGIFERPPNMSITAFLKMSRVVLFSLFIMAVRFHQPATPILSPACSETVKSDAFWPIVFCANAVAFSSALFCAKLTNWLNVALSSTLIFVPLFDFGFAGPAPVCLPCIHGKTEKVTPARNFPTETRPRLPEDRFSLYYPYLPWRTRLCACPGEHPSISRRC